jgi:hypothetical protein
MNYTDMLFYVLGAIQLGGFTKIKGFGNPRAIFDQKIKLVETSPIIPDQEDGTFHVRQKRAYDLFQVIVWLADHDGMELSIQSLEKEILHLIDDKSVYSFGDQSMAYYLQGAYDLCPLDKIVITRTKLMNLPKLEKTEFFKNIMFLFEANGANILTPEQVTNIKTPISQFVSLLESKIEAKKVDTTNLVNHPALLLSDY